MASRAFGGARLKWRASCTPEGNRLCCRYFSRSPLRSPWAPGSLSAGELLLSASLRHPIGSAIAQQVFENSRPSDSWTPCGGVGQLSRPRSSKSLPGVSVLRSRSRSIDVLDDAVHVSARPGTQSGGAGGSACPSGASPSPSTLVPSSGSGGATGSLGSESCCSGGTSVMAFSSRLCGHRRPMRPAAHPHRVHWSANSASARVRGVGRLCGQALSDATQVD